MTLVDLIRNVIFRESALLSRRKVRLMKIFAWAVTNHIRWAPKVGEEHRCVNSGPPRPGCSGCDPAPR